MADEPEVIRDQMQETRTALTEKLEALEQQVSNTVQSATTTVAETVQTVKDTVEDTVGTVKETVQETVSTVKHGIRDAFDLPGHVERHPWLAMAGSVAVGYLMGRLLTPDEPRRAAPSMPTSFYRPQPETPAPAPYHNGANGAEKEKESGESWMTGLMDTFSEPLGKLKDLGVSAMMALVRDLATRNMPGEIGSRVQTWMDDVTEKMGARPLAEPILPEEPASSSEGAPPPSGGGPQGQKDEPSGKKAKSFSQSRTRR